MAVASELRESLAANGRHHRVHDHILVAALYSDRAAGRGVAIVIDVMIDGATARVGVSLAAEHLVAYRPENALQGAAAGQTHVKKTVDG